MILDKFSEELEEPRYKTSGTGSREKERRYLAKE